MPAPTMPPITSMVASNRPSRRARGCDEAGSVCGTGELKTLPERDIKRAARERVENPAYRSFTICDSPRRRNAISEIDPVDHVQRNVSFFFAVLLQRTVLKQRRKLANAILGF